MTHLTQPVFPFCAYPVSSHICSGGVYKEPRVLRASPAPCLRLRASPTDEAAKVHVCCCFREFSVMQVVSNAVPSSSLLV